MGLRCPRRASAARKVYDRREFGKPAGPQSPYCPARGVNGAGITGLRKVVIVRAIAKIEADLGVMTEPIFRPIDGRIPEQNIEIAITSNTNCSWNELPVFTVPWPFTNLVTANSSATADVVTDVVPGYSEHTAGSVEALINVVAGKCATVRVARRGGSPPRVDVRPKRSDERTTARATPAMPRA